MAFVGRFSVFSCGLKNFSIKKHKGRFFPLNLLNTMNKLSREHIAWVDLLRVIACFLVVVAHACDPFVAQLDANRTDFLSGAFIGSLVRPCVPLFVMISGLLLLPVNMNMKDFYSRRAKRLIAPFVFWSLMMPVLYFLYVASGIQTVSPNLVAEDHTLTATLQKFYTFIFNFNYDTIPLWYVYMLIGLYLFMPIISAWLVQASKRDIQWFLRIWLVSMCLPYVEVIAPVLGYSGGALLGVCDWNPYGMLYYFSGFLGYIVLAYYLKQYPLNWNMGKRLAVGIPLFLLGYAITAGGFLYAQENSPGNFPMLEIPWYFFGLNVFVMTFSVYIIFQKLNVKASPLLSKVAALTFGIYLCHFVFVQLGYDLVYTNLPIPAFLKIILVAIIGFLISLFVIWLMSLNKYTRKVIM